MSESITLNWFERAAIRSIARKRVRARMISEARADLIQWQTAVRAEAEYWSASS
ncbi:hypothetical protein [Nocardioides sp.]|uniref:hypothetical protein n=1 Tax=Nocardioides sp. TaxID=35761 RepID=UPI0035614A2E